LKEALVMKKHNYGNSAGQETKTRRKFEAVKRQDFGANT
jgi:hypothetical protein